MKENSYLNFQEDLEPEEELLGEKLTTWTYMQKGETSRKQGNRRRAKEASGWAWMGPGRPAQAGRPSPIQGLFAPSFALAAIQAIYSP
jgi:hypothetical protein